MIRFLLTKVVVFMCVCVSANVEAGVRFTLDLAQWESRTSGREIVTSFDEPVWPVNTVLTGAWHVGGVTYIGLSGSPQPNIWVMESSVSPLTGQSLTANGDENIDITPDEAVTALGMEVSVNEFGPVFVRVFDGDGFEMGLLEVPVEFEGYVGITSDEPFARVNFRSTLGAVRDSFLDTVTLADAIDSCPADITGDGALNFFDVSAFLTAFVAGDAAADFTDDGLFNFFDVSAFLSAFSAGCP